MLALRRLALKPKNRLLFCLIKTPRGRMGTTNAKAAERNPADDSYFQMPLRFDWPIDWNLPVEVTEQEFQNLHSFYGTKSGEQPPPPAFKVSFLISHLFSVKNNFFK